VLALVEWVKDTLIWTRIKKLAKNHPFVSTPPQRHLRFPSQGRLWGHFQP
jgi:hypothetical protein